MIGPDFSPARLLTVASCLILVAAISSCDVHRSADDASVDLQQHFVIEAGDTLARNLLGSVLAARLTARGDRIVILDEFDPFVKVLNRDGRLLTAFGSVGQGPGEIQEPIWLGLHGDTVVAVVHRNGVSEFALDGTFLGSRPPLQRFLLGLSENCSDGWLVLGPEFLGDSGNGTNSWLVSMPFVSSEDGARAPPEVVLEDSVFPGTWSNLRVTNLTSDGRRFAFFRPEPDREVFLGDCTAGSVRSIPHELGYAGPDKVEYGVAPDGRRTRSVTPDPGPRHEGIGLLSEGVLLARRAWPRPTVVNLLGQPDSLLIVLPEGHARLMDARPGIGAVFAVEHPWPRVVFVSERDILGAFQDGS